MKGFHNMPVLYVIHAETRQGKKEKFKFKSNTFAFDRARNLARTSQYLRICVVEYLKNRAYETEINKVYHVK